MARPHIPRGGRKPRSVEQARREAIEQGKLVSAFHMLEVFKEEETWKTVVEEAKKAGDYRTVMSALMYWRDRAEGKPAQARTISGPGGRAVAITFGWVNGAKSNDTRADANGQPALES